jgi:hypothetical protein
MEKERQNEDKEKKKERNGRKKGYTAEEIYIETQWLNNKDNEDKNANE